MGSVEGKTMFVDGHGFEVEMEMVIPEHSGNSVDMAVFEVGVVEKLVVGCCSAAEARFDVSCCWLWWRWLLGNLMVIKRTDEN